MRRLLAIAFVLACSCTFDLTRNLGPGELRGSFVLQQGSAAMPVKGAVVSLAGGLAVRTDDRGRFVFRKLQAGTYRLQVRWDQDADGTIDAGLTLSRVEVTAGGRGRDLGTVAIGAPGSITGKIDDAGRLLSDLGVVISGLGDVACANDGKFDSGPLYPGTYDVAVHFLDEEGRFSLRTPQRVEVGVAQEVVLDAVLAAGSTELVTEPSSVAGLVVAPGAEAQAGTSVALVVSTASPALTDEAGLYSFASVTPGIYALQATREGFRAAVYDHLLVAGDTDVPTLALSPVDDPVVDPGVGCGEEPVVEDSDDDGIPNALELDGCLCDANDADEDGFCDSIDRDRDGDGIDNARDGCPDIADASQVDQDVDGTGDACDSDVDGDGVANASDLCPARFDLDQSASNCPTALVLTEPDALTVTSPTSVVTITGACPPPPATVAILLVAGDTLVSQSCDENGNFEAVLALDPTARTHAVRITSNGTPATNATYTYLLPAHATVGTGGDFATLDEAFASTTSARLLVLADGTHAMTGGRAISASFSIEAAPGTTPSITLSANLPDDANATSAWFNVTTGGSLTLRGVTLDGRDRVLRAGIVRVAAGARAELRDCVLRGAVAGIRGTAIWVEGDARVLNTALLDIGRTGVFMSGSVANVELQRVSMVGTGADSGRLNYFVVAQDGASLIARELAAVDFLGTEGAGGLPSEAIVVFDANVDIAQSVFTPTPANSAIIAIEASTTAGRTIRLRSNAFLGGATPEDHLALFVATTTPPTITADRSWWSDRRGPSVSTNPGGRGVGIVGTADYSEFARGFVDRAPSVSGWQR